jgi:holo-[acyl-carrier protein] synthase
MPLRVGIDLVSVDSVRESIETHGERYLERIYSDREVSDCRTAGTVDPERLAGRFAAKEATIKVLRPGDDPVPWREIEVQRDASGWVELRLTGRAARLASDAGIEDLTLSLTHERGLASAVVIAEIRRTADK